GCERLHALHGSQPALSGSDHATTPQGGSRQRQGAVRTRPARSARYPLHAEGGRRPEDRASLAQGGGGVSALRSYRPAVRRHCDRRFREGYLGAHLRAAGRRTRRAGLGRAGRGRSRAGEADSHQPGARLHRLRPSACRAASPLVKSKRKDRLRVVSKHHALVRLTHWINVPLVLGLVASGLAIYWAAPVFTHAPDPVTRSRDYLMDLGSAIAGLLHDRGGPPYAWIYDHFGLGTRLLASSLRLHWALAYLFMVNGMLYALGLAAGGGWRALLPRPSDVVDSLRMIRFYLGVIPMALLGRPWP